MFSIQATGLYLILLVLVHLRVEHFALGEDEKVRLPVEEVVALADVEDAVANGVGDVEPAAEVARLKGQPRILVHSLRQLFVLQDDPVL